MSEKLWDFTPMVPRLLTLDETGATGFRGLFGNHWPSLIFAELLSKDMTRAPFFSSSKTMIMTLSLLCHLHSFVSRLWAILTSLQKLYLLFGHVKNMRACVVLEITMLCTGFCRTSVLVQSVCDAWWGEQREGMVLWYVGVDFSCGTVGLQFDIFSTHMFCSLVVLGSTVSRQ